MRSSALLLWLWSLGRSDEKVNKFVREICRTHPYHSASAACLFERFEPTKTANDQIRILTSASCSLSFIWHTFIDGKWFSDSSPLSIFFFVFSCSRRVLFHSFWVCALQNAKRCNRQIHLVNIQWKVFWTIVHNVWSSGTVRNASWNVGNVVKLLAFLRTSYKINIFMLNLTRLSFNYLQNTNTTSFQ